MLLGVDAQSLVDDARRVVLRLRVDDTLLVGRCREVLRLVVVGGVGDVG